MADGQWVFKNTLGWDDWFWWSAIGCGVLLIVFLSVCCCVCMQCAKRKGREEALAAVQARQGLSEIADRVEHQPRQQQQQRYSQVQQTRDVAFGNDNGLGNGLQAAYGYSKPVTTVPSMPAQNRQNTRPHAAANGPSQLHTRPFARPYPSRLGQQDGHAAGQALDCIDQYEKPPKWHNAVDGQSRSPLISHGYAVNAPRLNNCSYNAYTSSQYPDSMRFEDPYPIDGNTDGNPFISVTSPSASDSLNANQKKKVRLQNHGDIDSELERIPAPVVVSRYTRALPPSPLEVGVSVDVDSGSLEGTLPSQSNALKLAHTNDTMHPRRNVRPNGLPHTSAKKGGASSAFGMPGTLEAQDSYASELTLHSRALSDNVVSQNSSALSNSLFFSSPSSSLNSDRSNETLNSEPFESAKSTVLGAVLTHGSSHSIDSDYSPRQFEDTRSFGPGGRDYKRNKSGNDFSTTPSRSIREDHAAFNHRGSIEF